MTRHGGRRRYKQRERARTVEATRRRILDAAAARLRRAPSQPVSVDAVASDAGVSRSTVYLAFGSRAGLLDAVAADVLHRAGRRRLVEAVAHSRAREALRGGLGAGAAMYAADPDAFRALFSMSALGEDATGGTIRRWERTRMVGVTRLAGRLADQGALRPGVTQREAVDLLWVLTSFEAFDLLHAGRSRDHEGAAAALFAAAERTLLA
jgi:AcrR family transcriptional regulator